MYPIDAISVRETLTGNGTITFASSTRTILGISTQKDADGMVASVYCNTTLIDKNFSGSRSFFNPVNYVCRGELKLTSSLTGGGVTSYLITYVNRDISLETGSTTQYFYNGFTYDGILIIMLLIFIFTLLFFKTLKEWIFGTKTEGTAKFKITSRK